MVTLATHTDVLATNLTLLWHMAVQLATTVQQYDVTYYVIFYMRALCTVSLCSKICQMHAV